MAKTFDRGHYFEMYTVYRRPKDCDSEFVVRRWIACPEIDEPIPCEIVSSGDTLDQARAGIPGGLFCMIRHPEDDPSIVESWF